MEQVWVIDAGGSSCDWWLCTRESVKPVAKTKGFNPNYNRVSEFLEEIAEISELSSFRDAQQVFWYGAGCSSESNQNRIRQLLLRLAPQATTEVKSDLWGAARACYEGEPHICAILGTGSNACFFDGNTLRTQKPSLGYLLGDEGSGNHIGRAMLKAYFHGSMPNELRESLRSFSDLNLNTVLERVYNANQPAAYLASFAPFAAQHQENPFVRNLLQSVFDAFIEQYLLPFPEVGQTIVSWVGSVAYHFRETISQRLDAYQLRRGIFVGEPGERLAQFHQPGS
ncbi:MAG: hypothetical protein EA392_10415 [Cryomorphaceae bacterium]|nr:MAG: hypothetical protein EA392_10415 [Cryomorphaceae bacterium]